MTTIDTGAVEGADVTPLLMLNFAGVCWNILCLLVFARIMTPDHWFERGIVEFGSAMGVLATGILLLRMADPSDETPVMRAFNLKQVVMAVFMGGGLCDAIAVVVLWHYGIWPVFWISFGITLIWATLCVQLRR